MTEQSDEIVHRHLHCGIDLAVLARPARPVAALEIRLLAGYAFERPRNLGVAHVLNEAITKGTEHYAGRAFNDAFDEIGAAHTTLAGRETFALSCLCLPEFMRRAVALHAELLRRPTFPQEACRVAVELAQQELDALNDDPDELIKKLINRQAYGEPLGRHSLGEPQTLANLARPHIVEHWRRNFSAERMLVALAGAVDPPAAADWLEEEFENFGAPTGGRPLGGPAGQAHPSGPAFKLDFRPSGAHHHKDLEQEHIAICFPGAAVTDDDFSVERVVLGILSGGASGRLFTEVREKQGLVYWVGAWSDYPRNAGMVHLGASSTPQNVGKTYRTLLREIDRLAEDLTAAEIARAKTGLITRARTQGEVTGAKAMELINDLFYFGRPIPTEEKLAKIEAVTMDDIHGYLAIHPRDRLAVVTLGPRALNGEG